MLLFWIKTAMLIAGPLIVVGAALAQPPEQAREEVKRRANWSLRHEAMVDISRFCPTICVELRYATERNFTGRQIYPSKARALIRRSVAKRLQQAQDELRTQGLGLKIWDAYRPQWAHEMLWKYTPNPEYVASPAYGGSYHSWGASVDVTLVDLQWQEQRMSTDFDDFTAAARSDYKGGDAKVAANLKALRTAMINAGFKGIRDEWWHYTAIDAHAFVPVEMPLEAGGKY